MSRSGYSDDYGDYDGNLYALWASIGKRARCGERGQRLLSDLCAALDTMPVKELIAEDLERTDGVSCPNGVCALGALGRDRKIEMKKIDPGDSYAVAEAFDMAPVLAREIVYQNDEAGHVEETPAQRWVRVRAWVASQIILEDE